MDQIQEIEGLADGSRLKGIKKGSKGYLWVGGDNGLFRFDGKRLDTLGLKFVKAIENSSEGKLLVLSDYGLFSVSSDSISIGFSVDTVLKAQAQVSETTLCYPKTLYQDKYGIIWIGENEQIVKYEKGRIHRFSNPYIKFKGFLRSSFFFAEDGFHRLWASSFKGTLHYYDREHDTFVDVTLPIKLDEVSSIISMGDERLWIGSSNGIFELITNEYAEVLSFKQLSDIPHVSQIEMLDDFAIIGTWDQGLYQMDMQGTYSLVKAFRYTDIIYLFSDDRTIWVTTNSDVLVINKTPFNILPDNFDRHIPSISLTKNNKLILNEGWRVLLAHSNFKGVRQEVLFDSKKKFWINNAELNKDTLILATTDGVFFYFLQDKSLVKVYDTRDQKNDDIWISNVLYDSDGGIWISYQSDEATTFIDPKEKISQIEQLKNCQFMREDEHGNFFAAGNEGELFVGKSLDNFRRVTLHFGSSQAPNILDLTFWQNTLYLATNSGIYSLDKEALNQDIVYPTFISPGESNSIAVDREGAIWFGTSRGLKRFWEGEIVSFDRTSGLPSQEIIERGLLVDHDNQLWCASPKGVAKTEKTFLSLSSYQAKISELTVNEKNEIVSGSHLGTFFSEGLLEIELATLFFPTSKVEYKTRLSANKKVIEERETGTNISFFDLPPKTYQLEIFAKQPGFKWSDPVNYTFTIKQHWYRTSWFFTLGLMLSLSLLFIAVRLYNKRLRQSREKLKKLVEARTEEIKNQKNALIDQQQKIIEHQRELIEKNDVLNETQGALNTSEIQFLELKRSQMQRELDLKSKELTSQTLSIVRKNQQLLDLSDTLSNLAHNKDTKDLMKEVSKLSQHIRNLLKQDERWEEFRVYFEQVHTDFYAKLKLSYPNLTSHDLKQCALVKLNLSLEDSAALTGISAESIRISRYRIQKKMGLSSQNTFVEYILKL